MILFGYILIPTNIGCGRCCILSALSVFVVVEMSSRLSIRLCAQLNPLLLFEFLRFRRSGTSQYRVLGASSGCLRMCRVWRYLETLSLIFSLLKRMYMTGPFLATTLSSKLCEWPKLVSSLFLSSSLFASARQTQTD